MKNRKADCGQIVSFSSGLRYSESPVDDRICELCSISWLCAVFFFFVFLQDLTFLNEVLTQFTECPVEHSVLNQDF